MGRQTGPHQAAGQPGKRDSFSHIVVREWLELTEISMVRVQSTVKLNYYRGPLPAADCSSEPHRAPRNFDSSISIIIEISFGIIIVITPSLED
jgi:hypothetical protein